MWDRYGCLVWRVHGGGGGKERGAGRTRPSRSTSGEHLQVSKSSPLPPHEASELKGLVGHVPQEMWQL